ncbi:MAG: ABC transporter substrate-binding protein, partial [Sideroxyarcus sp.]|nr:ABC transporter substrate-binding protein [Sideroxyarcus sp.]
LAASALMVSGIAAADEVPNFDPNTIETDAALSAKLPESIKKAGVLTVGSDTAYAPWEYISEADGKTVIGIDVDLGEAIAKTLGVKIDFQTSAFDAILPALGAKYDVGISAFSITNERMGAVNFVSYARSGSSWAVKAGNPKGFDPADICGRNIAVQTGSYYETEIRKADDECKKGGKPAINILNFASDPEALTRVAAGGADATISGSSTYGYAVKQSNGQLEVMKPAGYLGESGPMGIAVAKKDMALSELIAEAVNKLIKDGTFGKIYDMWGVSDSLIPVAEVNPKVAD